MPGPTSHVLNEQVELAGRRCLAKLGLSECGLTIRGAGPADGRALLEMESRAFPAFLRPQSALELEAYQGDNGQAVSFGYLVKVVAVRAGDLSGYTFLQVRNWDEVYILEMAARASRAAARTPFLGSILLGVAAELATELDKGFVTAHVCRDDKSSATAGYNSDLLISHCQKNGLMLSADRGILSSGEVMLPRDAWLKSSAHSILHTLARKRSILTNGGNEVIAYGQHKGAVDE